MRTFKVLAILLLYPEREWLAALDELEAAVRAETKRNKGADRLLAPLFARLRHEPLIALQQDYVSTFDQQPAHSLHLFEHIHGESRERGPAMVDLLAEYQRHGLEVDAAELPDYLPLFLEYLSLRPEPEAHLLLGEAVDVIAALATRLEQAGSPYQWTFRALERLSPRRPRPLTEQAPRDMERAMRAIGPSPDGMEPVVAPMLQKHRPSRGS
jgi:nitrate reductase delta subunit